MGSNGPGNQVFGVLLGLIVLTLVLVIVGFVLHRRGSLASRGAALGWAILTVLPLFGGGALYATKHVVEQATGVTKSNVNTDANRGAP